MTTPKLHALALTVLIGLGLVPLAQAAPDAAVASVRVVGADDVRLALGDGSVSLRLVAPGVLRVHYLPQGGASAPGLVMAPHPVAASFRPQLQQDGDTVTLRSDRLVATWHRASGKLEVSDAQGRPLLQQTDLAALAQGRIVLDHAPADALYGIGGYDAFEKDTRAGILRQGAQVAKAGEQGHAGAPFVWSTAGYGVLVDCDGADFDLAAGRIAIGKYARPDADYYILAGTPAELFGELADLSGHAPMFPKWANGFINSQWGIDEKEFRDIIATYRARHIPLDGFTFDFDWKDWGKDWGEFRWNARKFPDGPGGRLKADMDALGVHMTGIMKPRVHVDTVEGRYATAHDLWLPGEKASPDYFSHLPVKDIDFDKPAARAWWFNPQLAQSFDTGIVGWWNDEADTTPSNTQFLNMQRATWDGQRAHSKLRVWSINRNFWLGAQRYAYGLWSGDIPSSWASMAGQRERMLSAINVGEMQWGMDGGGFHGHPSDENYARWIEFGAFTPIFRVHGELDEKRQPWRYGPVAEAAATKAMRLRYTLLPYIYAYQHRASARGLGLVQPLNFVWPQDAKLRNDTEAWLFGDWLLVAPVVQQGQTSKQVYLPAGSWTEWFSGKQYQGGQTITVATDAKKWDDIPLFIRAGAIIPTQPAMDWTTEHPLTTVTVDVFPAATTSHFDYYDDDGETYAYADGAYFRQRLATQRSGDTVEFSTAAPEGSYRPALRHWLVRVHGMAAAVVDAGGHALAHAATPAALEAAGGEGWSTGSDRYGPVTVLLLDAATARTLQLRMH
ncbi:TIM-barrel domain-containing protein [Rhodanobacter sp. PCA2]|uniref:glycoside hydrolase family 31 protein n=1 Tax=Rhodanobacter sp. PCA2 TaxID=2006117 RepID=UPI0015E7013D|nr:TIM-barrel domain-containing protein [Rhodanobacter sp. PCA2]MBA2079893.1 glycoside hydrolase family 31 [Rhodanobacter sp. PCA2]